MNRIAFTIFGVRIAWYGIIITVAMLIGTYLLISMSGKRGYRKDDVYDFILAIIPSAIVGARLYYVAFEWHVYANDLWSIFAIRQGGLAIHGGIIGGLIAGFIVCKVKKWNFYDLADMVSIPLILGQAIGRWGNFANSEAHGGPTDLPWAIMVNGQSVHPTFLYESVWNLLIFIYLALTFKKRKFYGEFFIKYMMLYSCGRYFIEGLRTDSLMFMGLRVAQLVSVALIIIGAVLYVILSKKSSFKITNKQ